MNPLLILQFTMLGMHVAMVIYGLFCLWRAGRLDWFDSERDRWSNRGHRVLLWQNLWMIPIIGLGLYILNT